MKYSPSAHTLGSSGFFFDSDTSAPADTFGVAQSDVTAAINLPPGSTYTFTPPVDSDGAGTLVVSNPSGAFVLQQAKTAQIAKLNASYQSAILLPIRYTTAAGMSATFAQDTASKDNLQNAITAGAKAQAWPLNLWLDSSGNSVTPFSYTDLQGLAEAIENAEVPEYQDLLAKVAEVQAATTMSAVLAVSF